MAIPAVSLSQNPIRNQFAGLDTPVMREDQLGTILRTYQGMEAEKRALADAELQRQREAERFALEKEMEARRQQALNLEISEAKRRQLLAEQEEARRRQAAEGTVARLTGANIQVPVPQAQPLWEQPQDFGAMQAQYPLPKGQGMMLGEPQVQPSALPTWDETGGALLDQSQWTGEMPQFIRGNEFTTPQLGEVLARQGITGPLAQAQVLGDLNKAQVERTIAQQKADALQAENRFKIAEENRKNRLTESQIALNEARAQGTLAKATAADIADITPEEIANLPIGGNIVHKSNIFYKGEDGNMYKVAAKGKTGDAESGRYVKDKATGILQDSVTGYRVMGNETNGYMMRNPVNNQLLVDAATGAPIVKYNLLEVESALDAIAAQEAQRRKQQLIDESLATLPQESDNTQAEPTIVLPTTESLITPQAAVRRGTQWSDMVTDADMEAARMAVQNQATSRGRRGGGKPKTYEEMLESIVKARLEEENMAYKREQAQQRQAARSNR